MTRCRNCGKEWTGKRIEHCTVCHESFTGTTAGDRHRVGDHDVWDGPNRRRCLSAEEMITRGLRCNALGLWSTGSGTWYGSPAAEPS